MLGTSRCCESIFFQLDRPEAPAIATRPCPSLFCASRIPPCNEHSSVTLFESSISIRGHRLYTSMGSATVNLWSA